MFDALPPRQAMQANLARRSLADFVRLSWPVLEPATPLVWNWHIEAVCDHVQALLEGRLAKRNLMINVPPGSMKPVSDDAIVATDRGPVALRDVAVGDRVLTHHGRFRRVAAVHIQGTLPAVRITTLAGRALVAAPDHPVLTTEGWVGAGAITSQHVLAAISPTESFGTPVAPEEARFLGYMVGDGSSAHASLGFTNADDEILGDFERCAASLGFVTSRVRKQGCAAWTVRLSSRRDGSLQRYLADVGLRGANSYTKRVPAKIQRADAAARAHFLGAYFSCDGSCGVRHAGTKTSYFARITTVGEGLAYDTQSLFLSLGIETRVRRKSRNLRTRRQGDAYVSFDVGATTQDEVAKFRDLPGLCRAKTRRIAGAVRRSFAQHLHPDPVVSTASAGSVPCRCLSVDEDRSFTANGLAVHNSRIVSVCTPAWWWIDHPEWRGIFASANPNVTTRDSLNTRLLVQSRWYQDMFHPAWRLASDQNVKLLFKTDRGGSRHAVTTNTRVSGDRGDALFGDDLLDAADAFSKAKREAANTWYDQAYANRLNDLTTGTRCMIGQRLHQDDPYGHMLQAPEEWEHLLIRQEFDPDTQPAPTSLGWTDPRTEKGELLDARRFPKVVLLTERRRLGSAGYAGQHQQSPTAPEGTIYKRDWWKSYTMPSGSPLEVVAALGLQRVVIGWDTALSQKTEADHSACVVIGVAQTRYYVLDFWQEKVESPTAKAQVRMMHAKWNASADVIEGGSSHGGKAIAQMLKDETNLPIIEVTPNVDKVAAANEVSPIVEAGQVYMPVDLPWAADLIESLAMFPRAEHDDDADAFRISLRYASKGGGSTGMLDYLRELAAAKAAAAA